eukprot:403377491
MKNSNITTSKSLAFTLLGLAVASNLDSAVAFGSQNTCAFTQNCVRIFEPPMAEAPCQDPSPFRKTTPGIQQFQPTQLLRQDSKQNLEEICPSYNGSEPLCCNDDQVQYLAYEFRQIDAVFGSDCSICAVNLKRMWCDFTCSPNQSQFVNPLAYYTTPDQFQNITIMDFYLNPTHAQAIYDSCSKVLIVQQANLTYFTAFFDFLGTDAYQMDVYYLNFKYTLDQSQSLNGEDYTCDQPVSPDGNFEGYTGCKNCTCDYCDRSCNSTDQVIINENTYFLQDIQ